MKKIKIGFLPFYIKLYDECGLPLRERLTAFYNSIADNFEKDGFDVIRTPICCVKDEFKKAVDGYEKNGADCIVTWHAAYSPSLEASEILAKTKLPIVVLDTTDTYDFSSPDDINFCHGIHGVMDMCNLMKQNGKKYAIAAGFYPGSDVVDRAEGFVRAAVAANSIKGSRTGSIGGSFEGMGDFLISDDALKSRFGATAVYSSKKELDDLRETVTEDEIAAEMKADLEHYNVTAPLDPKSHRRTVLDCLTVRKWIEKNKLDAFTVNFTKIGPECGMNIMPFMEACKEMAAGIGYAGEGDVLTATITGALIRGFKTASFVEIFCPDWKRDLLLLSHMGEYNEALADGQSEMKEIPFVFGHADDPVVSYACYKAGDAVFCNVFKDKDDYKLLVSPVEMVTKPVDKFAGSVRGWLRPPMPVADFLEAISTEGVTHHSSLVYGATVEQLAYFGEMLDMDVIVVE